MSERNREFGLPFDWQKSVEFTKIAARRVAELAITATQIAPTVIEAVKEKVGDAVEQPTSAIKSTKIGTVTLDTLEEQARKAADVVPYFIEEAKEHSLGSVAETVIKGLSSRLGLRSREQDTSRPSDGESPLNDH